MCKAPSDIREVFSLIKLMVSEVPDIMRDQYQSWLDDLRLDFRKWKAGGDEPNWNKYRNWMNQICQEDTMPKLFEEVNHGSRL